MGKKREFYCAPELQEAFNELKALPWGRELAETLEKDTVHISADKSENDGGATYFKYFALITAHPDISADILGHEARHHIQCYHLPFPKNNSLTMNYILIRLKEGDAHAWDNILYKQQNEHYYYYNPKDIMLTGFQCEIRGNNPMDNWNLICQARKNHMLGNSLIESALTAGILISLFEYAVLGLSTLKEAFFPRRETNPDNIKLSTKELAELDAVFPILGKLPDGDKNYLEGVNAQNFSDPLLTKQTRRQLARQEDILKTHNKVMCRIVNTRQALHSVLTPFLP